MNYYSTMMLSVRQISMSGRESTLPDANVKVRLNTQPPLAEVMLVVPDVPAGMGAASIF